MMLKITPKCPKWINRKVYEQLERKYADTVFDRQRGAFDGSKTIYCSRPLKLTEACMTLPVSVKLDNGIQ